MQTSLIVNDFFLLENATEFYVDLLFLFSNVYTVSFLWYI